jgi:hypothetical protein
LDGGLLEEAQAKYANNPQVNLVGYFSGRYDRQQPASPERRSLLDCFKQSDPQNSLGNYLAASDFFKLGQIDKALKELRAGTGKTTFRDYSEEFIQTSEEAWQAAGYTEAKAKAVASASLRIAPIVELKRLGERLASLANAYQQAGDAASTRALLHITAIQGKQLDQPSATGLVRNLAGLRIELQVLSALAPTTPYDDNECTVADRLAQIAQRHAALLSLSEEGVKAQQASVDSDLVSFYDQQKAFGSERALRWLVGRQAIANGLE